MSSRCTVQKNRISKKIKVSTRKASTVEMKMFDSILHDVETKGDSLEWTEVIGDNQNPIDLMKHQICQSFIRLITQTGIPQVRLAELIGVDRSRVNDIVHGRYHLFSLETLINYILKLEGLSPSIDKKISDIRKLTES